MALFEEDPAVVDDGMVLDLEVDGVDMLVADDTGKSYTHRMVLLSVRMVQQKHADRILSLTTLSRTFALRG